MVAALGAARAAAEIAAVEIVVAAMAAARTVLGDVRVAVVAAAGVVPVASPPMSKNWFARARKSCGQ